MNTKLMGSLRGEGIYDDVIDDRMPTNIEEVDFEDPEAVFKSLNSENPIKTLYNLFEFSKEPENCELFSDLVPTLLKTLDFLSKGENPKISDLGKRVIVNIFSVFPGEEPTNVQNIVYQYLCSLNNAECEDFPLFFSLMNTTVSRSIMIKKYMISIGALNTFAAINPETVPEVSLFEYSNVISHFLAPETKIDDSVRLDLMDRIRVLIENVEDEDVINTCIRAIDRITTDVSFTPSFISSETFPMLISKYESFSSYGKSLALSIFSHCYGCTVPLLRARVLELVPLQIFASELENEDSIVRINSTISLINCFRNEPSTIGFAFENGIVNAMFQNLSIDNFEIRKCMIRALYVCAESSNVEQFALFETEEFIDVLEDILSSDDPEAVSYIAQFVELYRERSSEEDSPHIFDLIDEFMMSHDLDADEFRYGIF